MIIVGKKAFPDFAVVVYNSWLEYSPLHWWSFSQCLWLESTVSCFLYMYICLVSMVC